MVAVQSNNVSAVNEALNEIYVEEEDYERLRESIDMHDNFDQIGLAQKVKCNCSTSCGLVCGQCQNYYLFFFFFNGLNRLRNMSFWK